MNLNGVKVDFNEFEWRDWRLLSLNLIAVEVDLNYIFSDAATTMV